MSKTCPTVSIVVPNRNKESFLTEMLRSVQSQTYLNWELIFVDDGSTDRSVEITRSFAEGDPRIQCVTVPKNRSGGSAARNHGLSLAGGKYVMFLDSDDLLASECLASRIDQLESTKVDFVVFPMGTFTRSIGDGKSVWRPTSRDPLRSFLQHQLPWAVMSPMFKTSFARMIEGFDERYPRLQDVEFHTRCLLSPNVSYVLNAAASPDCYYRIIESRTSIPHSEQLQHYVVGIELYLESFHKPAMAIGSAYVNALAVTLFRGLERICLYRHQQRIDQIQFASLTTRLMSSDYVARLPKWKERILQIYIKMASRKQSPKGVGFLVRALLRY